MKVETTATRLKNLRESAKLSHAKLRIELIKKYNIPISVVTLKKYEVSDKFHINYGALKGMKIEFLDMFADFYGVSTDYILGRTNSISTDLSEQTIYNETGLSSTAINNLKELWNSRTNEPDKLYHIKVFDSMLSDLEFIKSFSRRVLKYSEYDYQSWEMITDAIHKQNLDKKKSSNLDIKKGFERYLMIHEFLNFIQEFSITFLKIKNEIAMKKYLDVDINERWDLYDKENK